MAKGTRINLLKDEEGMRRLKFRKEKAYLLEKDWKLMVERWRLASEKVGVVNVGCPLCIKYQRELPNTTNHRCIRCPLKDLNPAKWDQSFFCVGLVEAFFRTDRTGLVVGYGSLIVASNVGKKNAKKVYKFLRDLPKVSRRGQ